MSAVAFSKFNLIGDDAGSGSLKRKLFYTIISPTLSVEVSGVPFIKLKNICNHIESKTDCYFNPGDLLEYLSDDFVEYVYQKSDVREVWVAVTKLLEYPLVLSHYNIQDKTIIKKNDGNTKSIKLKMKRKDLLTLELLLHSIYEQFECKLSVEELFSLLLYKFLDDFDRGNKESLNSIIEYLLDDEEEEETTVNEKNQVEDYKQDEYTRLKNHPTIRCTDSYLQMLKDRGII